MSPRSGAKSVQDKITELSKHVLVIAMKYFSKIIDLNRKRRQAPEQQRRSANIHNKPNHIDTRPRPSSIREINDVNKKFELMQQSRTLQLTEKKTIDFKEPVDSTQFRDVNKAYERLAHSRGMPLQNGAGAVTDSLGDQFKIRGFPSKDLGSSHNTSLDRQFESTSVLDGSRQPPPLLDSLASRTCTGQMTLTNSMSVVLIIKSIS